MTAAYLSDGDLTGAVTTYGGQGVDFTTLTSGQRANLIAQASKKIDGHLRDTLALTNVNEYYRGTGTNFLRLRHYPLWAGLTTTLSGTVAKGATTATVASATGLLPGQALVFDDGLEASILLDPTYTAGSTSLVLATATTVAHSSGAKVHVNPVDYITIILPGGSVYPLPVAQLVVEPQQGMLQNYTPLMFQQLGYSTIFPRDVPLLANYTYGYLSGAYPDAVTQTCLELCIGTVARNVSYAVAGRTSVRVGNRQETYSWEMPELTPDQQRRLGPWMRGRGIY